MIRRSTLLVALGLVSAPLYATTYTLEPNHTQGVLSWNHLGFSNPGALFSRIEGTLDYDPADPTRSSVMVTIALDKISSGVPELDEELRSDEFFDIAKFPVATFTSNKVEKAAAPGQLKVSGQFSLHGISKPVTLWVSLNKLGENPRRHLPSIGFEAMTTLQRSDFGLGRFVPQVSDAVQVRITCQADEAKAYAEQRKKEAAEEKAAALEQAAATKPGNGKDASKN